MSHNESITICGQFTTIERDLDGNVLKMSESENLIVNVGKAQVLNLMFIAGATGQFPYLAVGASSTPAVITDTRLTYELLGEGSRILLTSNKTGNVGNALSAANDITAETVTIGSNTFTYKFVGQVQYSAGSGNNGNILNEYGLFTTSTLPATPTSSQPIMLNHYIDLNPINKASTNTGQVVVTIRF